MRLLRQFLAVAAIVALTACTSSGTKSQTTIDEDAWRAKLKAVAQVTPINWPEYEQSARDLCAMKDPSRVLAHRKETGLLQVDATRVDYEFACPDQMTILNTALAAIGA